MLDPSVRRSFSGSFSVDGIRLEAALREISSFSEADGSGHNPAKCPKQPARRRLPLLKRRGTT